MNTLRLVTEEPVTTEELAEAVHTALADGGTFVGVFGVPRGSAVGVVALVLGGATLRRIEGVVDRRSPKYPALTPTVPGALWYERALHDLTGVVPIGHPRLDPLVFPVGGQEGDLGVRFPIDAAPNERLVPATRALSGQVVGEGVFTIPYGPVRSGVFESVEYLVETDGEDIPRLRVRPYHKHRGVAAQFRGQDLEDGLWLAERYEGTLSVAHATAYASALESLAGVEVPPRGALLRLVHAELERIAHHLDSMIRLSEGAGQAVAYARLAWYRERVLRLIASLCGHRFGRGVVALGGVAGPPQLDLAEARRELSDLAARLESDLERLMLTPSFLDRLRGTGALPPEAVAKHQPVGPVGRGSGIAADARVQLAYGGYRLVAAPAVAVRQAGDALARQQVRIDEVRGSISLVLDGLSALRDASGPWRVGVDVPDGQGAAIVEAPQGALVYLVEVNGGRLSEAIVRTASFHNFALFSSAFQGDILTDFVFIEASFDASMAGVAG